VLIHQILKIDPREEVFLAEESLADLIALPVTMEVLESGEGLTESIEIREVGDGRDEEGGDGALLGVALKIREPADLWLLLTDRYGEIDLLGALPQASASKVVRAREEKFLEALVEWLSFALKEELFCESCPVRSPPLFVPEREASLERFLRSHLPRGGEVLEICCGSGMATQTLKSLGFRPWTADLDSCEICLGLKSGHLDPTRAMVLDARLLSRFIPPRKFDAVVGFMVGLIDAVNWPLWKDILTSSAELAKDLVIYTTYTEREAKMVAEAMNCAGWVGEVVANPDDLGIYDQWAWVGRRRR
jgi:SAM-dependent methyltransferase